MQHVQVSNIILFCNILVLLSKTSLFKNGLLSQSFFHHQLTQILITVLSNLYFLLKWTTRIIKAEKARELGKDRYVWRLILSICNYGDLAYIAS